MPRGHGSGRGRPRATPLFVIQIIGRPDYIGFIDARLILRTGISLKNVDRDYAPHDINRVVAALRDMGYDVERSTI